MHAAISDSAHRSPAGAAHMVASLYSEAERDRMKNDGATPSEVTGKTPGFWESSGMRAMLSPSHLVGCIIQFQKASIRVATGL